MSYEEQVEYLYEDEHILVCRKPAGLAVQSARLGTMDLESMLRNHLAEQGDTPYLAVIREGPGSRCLFGETGAGRPHEKGISRTGRPRRRRSDTSD